MNKLKNIFTDTTDLDLAHQEIGYLKDLCDAKDNVIAYQKELLRIQGESIKEQRITRELYEQALKDIDKLQERMEKYEGKKSKR